MSADAKPPITTLLHAWQLGDSDAFGQVIQTVQGELLRMALGLSVPTIDRELRFARAWLSTQLQRDLQA